MEQGKQSYGGGGGGGAESAPQVENVLNRPGEIGLRNLQLSFFPFFYQNFEDTVNNFHKDMLRKESFCGTNPYSEMKTILKVSLFVFNYKTAFIACCSILEQNVKKLLRNISFL